MADDVSGTKENTMRMVHIWADVEDDWRPSSARAAHKHRKSGDTSIGVGSLSSLKRVFDRLKNTHVPLHRMDFHTHGGPGGLAIGSEWLGIDTVREFHGHKFETVFASNARIFFHGCNVAERAVGELFLALCGVIFLNKGGGRVGASSTAGYMDPIITGKVFHSPGSAVYANIKPGGWVELQNHSHLNLAHLEAHTRFLDETFPLFRDQGSAKVLQGKEHLRKSKEHLKKGSFSTIASIWELYWAHGEMVKAAEIAVKLAKDSSSITIENQIKLQYRFWLQEAKLGHLH
jgi:hypothetical protein